MELHIFLCDAPQHIHDFALIVGLFDCICQP